VQQVCHLRNARLGDFGQAGQLDGVGDGAAPQKVVELEGQHHDPPEAGHAARWDPLGR
jgi:hypothetical protein